MLAARIHETDRIDTAVVYHNRKILKPTKGAGDSRGGSLASLQEGVRPAEISMLVSI